MPLAEGNHMDRYAELKRAGKKVAKVKEGLDSALSPSV
jgi:hypothetical protein